VDWRSGWGRAPTINAGAGSTRVANSTTGATGDDAGASARPSRSYYLHQAPPSSGEAEEDDDAKDAQTEEKAQESNNTEVRKTIHECVEFAAVASDSSLASAAPENTSASSSAGETSESAQNAATATVFDDVSGSAGSASSVEVGPATDQPETQQQHSAAETEAPATASNAGVASGTKHEQEQPPAVPEEAPAAAAEDDKKKKKDKGCMQQ